ncbi:MAG TPA: hypothetical protein PLI17_13740, partial [Denitromonas sp.]|nr:hypothetical protein [Denitromonas sp.]
MPAKTLTTVAFRHHIHPASGYFPLDAAARTSARWCLSGGAGVAGQTPMHTRRQEHLPYEDTAASSV